ncbi:MAG: hypothetical protein LBE20_02250 [Deltaproteobacteria bacterium]|jgi:hypothetical protein|nr:hypothetical protein [Deltaproteobacteria bacterium]
MYIKPLENTAPRESLKKTVKKPNSVVSFEEELIKSIEDSEVVDLVQLTKDNGDPEPKKHHSFQQEETPENNSSTTHKLDIKV